MTFPSSFCSLALLAANPQTPSRLISLHSPDIVIIAIYFATVLGIGVYLRRYTKSGKDFFLAGREMTPPILARWS
jgi:SSS family solute:Na+ symporter